MEGRWFTDHAWNNITIWHFQAIVLVLSLQNVYHAIIIENSGVNTCKQSRYIRNVDRPLYLASVQKNAILVNDDMYSWAKIWISKQEIIPAIVDKHEIANMMYKKKSFLISALPMNRTVDELVQCYLDIEKTIRLKIQR